MDKHTPITFYKAGHNDLLAMMDLRIDFIMDINGQKTPEAITQLKQHLRNYFTKALNNQSYLCYLAKQNDTLAGMGALVIREEPGNFKNPAGRIGYLINMYTVPAFRRKGICCEIMNRLIDDAHQMGITAFELIATPEGEMVYTQCGFEKNPSPQYRRFL